MCDAAIPVLAVANVHSGGNEPMKIIMFQIVKANYDVVLVWIYEIIFYDHALLV